jgi:hypothetical protein
VAPLSREGWRAFRLWLNALADELLAELRTDVETETAARVARDRRIDRLFFSALSDADLAAAREFIDDEVRERASAAWLPSREA